MFYPASSFNNTRMESKDSTSGDDHGNGPALNQTWSFNGQGFMPHFGPTTKNTKKYAASEASTTPGGAAQDSSSESRDVTPTNVKVLSKIPQMSPSYPSIDESEGVPEFKRSRTEEKVDHHSARKESSSSRSNSTVVPTSNSRCSEKMEEEEVFFASDDEDDLPLGSTSSSTNLVSELAKAAQERGLSIKIKFHEEEKLMEKKKKDVEKKPRLPAGCQPFVSEKNMMSSQSVSTTDEESSAGEIDPELVRKFGLPAKEAVLRGPAHGDNSKRTGWRHLNRPLIPGCETLYDMVLAEKQRKEAENNDEEEEVYYTMDMMDLLDERPPEILMQSIGDALYDSSQLKNEVAFSGSTSASSLSTASAASSLFSMKKPCATKIDWYIKKMRSDSRYCPFFSQTVPGISIVSYLNRLRTHFRSTGNCFLAALIYLDRFGAQAVNMHTIHRLSLTALVVGTKYVESDCYYENAHYGRCGGVSRNEMNELESIFLELLGWDLHISIDEFERYRQVLCDFVE